MTHARPTGAVYRNAAGALVLAFRMLFINELAARRSFRTTLDRWDRRRTLLALRSAPETFGPLLPHVDLRTVELVDEAAREFAACRAARPRALFRKAADILRRGYMLALIQEDRAQAAKALETAMSTLTDLEERRKWVAGARKQLESKVPGIFSSPVDVVVERIIAFGAEYGVRGQDDNRGLWSVAYWKPETFGRLRRMYLKSWRDSCKELQRWLGFPHVWPRRYQTTEADGHIVSFRSAATGLVEAIQRNPSDSDMEAARERAEAAATALDAFGPEDEEQRDTYRACRQAAPIVLDAMRRLERDPSDAATQVKRQLGRMLPSGAQFLISYTVQLAAELAKEERRNGTGRPGERGHSRDH